MFDVSSAIRADLMSEIMIFVGKKKVGNRMDPAIELFNVKHSNLCCETNRLTFKWKYDVSQKRAMLECD